MFDTLLVVDTVAAAGGLAAFGVPVVHWMRDQAVRSNRIERAITGEPAADGIPARPGIFAKVDEIKSSLDDMRVTFEARFSELAPRIAVLETRLGDLSRAMMRVDEDRLPELREGIAQLERIVTELRSRVQTLEQQSKT